MFSIGQPFSHELTKFEKTRQDHNLNPNTCPYWGPSYRKPYPTNTWWINLVLDGNNPIQTYPYLIKAHEGFKICYPSRVANPDFILEPFVDNLTLTAKEPMGTRSVMCHDDLSVTVRYSNPYDRGATLQSPIFRGQVYHTVEYNSMTPLIRSIHAILKVNGRYLNEYYQGGGATNTPTLSTNKLKLELNNGQTWIVYSSSTIAWNIGMSHLEAYCPFQGVIRVAHVLQPNFEPALDQFQGTYPVSAIVDMFVAHTEDSGDVGTVVFRFSKRGNGPIILFTLPHHRDILREPIYTRPRLRYRSIKGWCEAVIGDEWLMDDTLVQDIGFYSRYSIPMERIPTLVDSLRADSDFMPTANDPYFYGKSIAKLGRLAVIADELAQPDLARKIRENMKQSIDKWLDGVIYNATEQDNKLVYERSYGALVSKKSVGNPHADFGQYYMNDHHFHYGYFVYAAACIIKEDIDWGKLYRSKILEIVRDYANPSKNDPEYPYLRCKDWYTGHSFASGLFPFADSRNQESTSEAVNAYYAVYLLGMALNDENMTDVGRLLMQTEIRSAQKYWQIKDENNDIYEREFSKNRVVGVLWETKVDYATFFGKNVEYIHGIQMLPFTPITEDLLDPDWIKGACQVYGEAFRRSQPKLEEGWKGFLLMANSIIDKEGATNFIQKLTGFDDGNSRTNTLYFLYTRPGRDNHKRASIYSGVERRVKEEEDVRSNRSMLVPYDRRSYNTAPLSPEYQRPPPQPIVPYRSPTSPMYRQQPPYNPYQHSQYLSPTSSPYGPPPPVQHPYPYHAGYPARQALTPPPPQPSSQALSPPSPAPMSPGPIAVYPGVIVYKRERMSTRARKMLKRAKKEFF